MAYTNSSLVSFTQISPNQSGARNHKIDSVAIHCVVGQCSVETLGRLFQTKQASANYGIGYDGRVGLYVEEKDRSWCTSSSEVDNRAVTIEVASDAYYPYAINQKAYNTLINLLTDICKRNGIKKLIWSTSKYDRMHHVNGCNMMAHRDYAQKSCVPIGSEVLTKAGWKTLEDIEVGEEIAVVSPEKDYPIFFDSVIEKIEPYMAETVTCQNFTGTLNHRMIYNTAAAPDNIRFIEYGDLLESGGTRKHLPLAGHFEGAGLDMSDDLLRFLVAMQADGHYMIEYRADPIYTYGVEFHLKEERKINRIISLIESLGYSYTRSDKADGSVSIRIYNDKDRFRITDICKKWLTDKHFDWRWINLSPHQAQVFFKELTEWDDCTKANLYTAREQINLDIVSAICVLNGIAGHIKDFNYQWRQADSYGISKHTKRIVNDKELVSCVTVATGAFVCRQNGYTFLIGNCPGDWIYNREGQIAAEVNKRLMEDDDNMTQEQFNQMADNWANAKSNETQGSPYALDSLSWGQKNGLMAGNESGNLMPKGFLTREQFITVLKRFYDKLGIKI